MSTDLAGAAPAAADSASMGGAPISDTPTNFNAPLGSQVPADAAKPEAPKGPPSLDDSIDRAFAKSEARAAEGAKPAAAEKPADKAKPDTAKPEQPRENGRFAAKESAKPDPAIATAKPAPAAAAKPADQVKPSHTAEDAPARFTETAKAKWHAADPEIRGEVLRMQRELTDGYQKHKAAADRDASVAEFHDMATKSNTTLRDALTRYTGLENKIRADLLGGLDEVINNATDGKYSLRDIAAHVMGQTPEQNQSQSDATIRELKNTIARLEQQVGGVVQTVQQQRETATLTEINKFAADHPRFEELSEDIALFMKTGRAKNLPDAYALAERLNPAPAKATEQPAASSAVTDPSAQPDKGQKSIDGAPSSGLTSQPGKKRAALSIDESLNRAFGQVG